MDATFRGCRTAKINLVFEGIPGLVKVVGKRIFEFDLEGQTMADLLMELVDKYGEVVKQIFWNESAEFNPSIQVVVNWRDYIQIDKLTETLLSEGDTVIFIILLNGG